MIDISTEFPRRTVNRSLSGAMPKLSVRLMGEGTHTNAASNEERQLACENAENPAKFLKGHVLKKETENLEWARDAVLSHVDTSLAEKYGGGQWAIEPPKEAWVVRRLAQLLGE